MRIFITFLFSLIFILNLSSRSVADDSDIPIRQQKQQVFQKLEIKPSTEQTVACYSEIALAVLTLGLIGLILKQIKDDGEHRRYDYLANLYYKIFELGIKYPKLINEAETRDYRSSFSEDDAIRYNAYAHMVWAHAEDIFDRTRPRQYKDLRKIYEPTFKRYYLLHGTWYENNKTDFRAPGFDEYVKSNDP